MGKPGFLKSIKRVINKIKNKVKPVVQKVRKTVKKILGPAQKVLKPLNNIVQKIKPFVKPIIRALPYGNYIEIGTDVASGVLEGATNVVEKANQEFNGKAATFSQDGKTVRQIKERFDQVRNIGGTIASELNRMRQRDARSREAFLTGKPISEIVQNLPHRNIIAGQRRHRSTGNKKYSKANTEISERDYSSWEKSVEEVQPKIHKAKSTKPKIPNFLEKPKKPVFRTPVITEDDEDSDYDDDFTPGNPPSFLSKSKTVTSTVNDIPFLNNKLN